MLIFQCAMTALIMQRLRQAFGNCRLEDLQVPLRVAATHADAGHAVFIRQGNLVDALRASDGHAFHVCTPSGGRATPERRFCCQNPLPVGAATDAHTVIALGFDAPMPHRVNAPSRLLAQNHLDHDQQPHARTTCRSGGQRHAVAAGVF